VKGIREKERQLKEIKQEIRRLFEMLDKVG